MSNKLFLRFSHLFTGMIVLAPLLSFYQYHGMIVYYFILLIVLFVKVVLDNKINFYVPKRFWLFFGYLIVGRIVQTDNLDFSNLFSLSVISFILTVACAGFYFQVDFALKFLKYITGISIVYFLVQECMYTFYAYRLIPLIPLELYGDETYAAVVSRLSTISRSSSFFLEPSYFSEFLLVSLALELGRPRKLIISNWAILISFILLMLKSGLGLIIMAVLWLLWFFLWLRDSYRSSVRKLLTVLVFIPTAVMVIFFYINSARGNEVLERSSEFGIVDGTTSTYVRIFRGYDLFSNFSSFQKIFGINSASKIKNVISNSSMSDLFPVNDLSFNAIQSVMLFSGIIGIVLFAFHFSYLVRCNTGEGKMVGALLLLASFISAFFVKPYMLFLYSFILAYHKKQVSRLKGRIH